MPQLIGRVWMPKMVTDEDGKRVVAKVVENFAVIPYRHSTLGMVSMLWSVILNHRIICMLSEADAKRVGEFLLDKLPELWNTPDYGTLTFTAPQWLKRWLKVMNVEKVWIDPEIEKVVEEVEVPLCQN